MCRDRPFQLSRTLDALLTLLLTPGGNCQLYKSQHCRSLPIHTAYYKTSGFALGVNISILERELPS